MTDSDSNPTQRSDGPKSDRRQSGVWLRVHAGHVAILAVFALGYLAFHQAARGLFNLLARVLDDLPGSFRIDPESIDYVFRIFDPWLHALPWIVVVLAGTGWLFPLLGHAGGTRLRRWPWFLLSALLWRRLPHRRCRPHGTSYWRHPLIRARWLLLVVKAVFLPIAIGSLWHSVTVLDQFFKQTFALDTVPPAEILGPWIMDYFVFYSFMLVDSTVASLAYSLESGKLKCEIKAVEMRLRGWLPCVFCYPPLILITQHFLILRNGPENLLFQSPGLLLACKVMSMLFFALYVVGTVTLGMRYSNLSYRGTTTRGFFSIVRHPQYTTKLGTFFFDWLPYFAFLPNILCLAGWFALYTARALTEEGFLSRFADYREYRARVPWRFIPGIW